MCCDGVTPYVAPIFRWNRRCHVVSSGVTGGDRSLQVVDHHLRREKFDQSRIALLSQNVLTSTMESLHNLNPSYKYIGA